MPARSISPLSTSSALLLSLSSGLLAVACLAAPVAAQQGRQQLAPGVLTVIPGEPAAGETFSGPRPIVELMARQNELSWTPNYHPKSETLLEMARQATFRRNVWNLEFAFKPLRMIYVDVPQPSGKMQRKLIWYMVYRVRYLGNELKPSAAEDQWGHTTFPSTTPVNYESRRFFPAFVLESHEFDKSYLDRVIPAAKKPIELREQVPGPLYNSVEITEIDIPLSSDRIDRSVWGVVTWEDVDPRIDFFSIYVQGLTNAFRFDDPEGAFQAGDAPGTGRQFQSKMLQLNFWRPGDARFEHEKEVQYGVPVETDPAEQQRVLDMFGLNERLDHLWIYR